MGGGECVEEGGSDGGARVGREGEEAGTGALRAEAEGVGVVGEVAGLGTVV